MKINILFRTAPIPRSLLRGWMPPADIGAKPLSVIPRGLPRGGFIQWRKNVEKLALRMNLSIGLMMSRSKFFWKALVVIFSLSSFAVSLSATTQSTMVERQMQELRMCMQRYAQDTKTIPFGENAIVVGKLRRAGFTPPERYLTADGSYLDFWGNPFYFIPTKDGSVIILSLGEKIANAYPSPAILIVKPEISEMQKSKPAEGDKIRDK